MPSNLLNADISFPQFTRETSDREKIEQITSYLYMLLEQLRYSLTNLDKDNFNEAGLGEIGKIITDPVYVRLAGAEGGLHELNVTAQLLSSRIQDAEGNVSALQQTARALTSRIADTEGSVSLLQQTAQSLSSRIQDAEGNASAALQTAYGMRLSVVNGDSSSTITLTANGAAISAQNISFTGMVTYAGLAGGTTTINGACIKTGTIDGDRVKVSSLYGQYVYLNNAYGIAMGRISITGADTSFASVDLTSYGALRLTAQYGAAYLASDSHGTYVGAYDRVYTRGALVSNNMSSLGDSAYRWSDVYANNAVIQTSDLTVKEQVEYGLERYEGLFDALRPMSFLFKDGESGRRHLGLGAQDVERAMAEQGVSDMEFAGFIRSPKGEGKGFSYALRYGEFIPLCIDQLQRLKGRVDRLEKKNIQEGNV